MARHKKGLGPVGIVLFIIFLGISFYAMNQTTEIKNGLHRLIGKIYTIRKDSTLSYPQKLAEFDKLQKELTEQVAELNHWSNKLFVILASRGGKRHSERNDEVGNTLGLIGEAQRQLDNEIRIITPLAQAVDDPIKAIFLLESMIVNSSTKPDLYPWAIKQYQQTKNQTILRKVLQTIELKLTRSRGFESDSQIYTRLMTGYSLLKDQSKLTEFEKIFNNLGKRGNNLEKAFAWYSDKYTYLQSTDQKKEAKPVLKKILKMVFSALKKDQQKYGEYFVKLVRIVSENAGDAVVQQIIAKGKSLLPPDSEYLLKVANLDQNNGQTTSKITSSSELLTKWQKIVPREWGTSASHDYDPVFRDTIILLLAGSKITPTPTAALSEITQYTLGKMYEHCRTQDQMKNRGNWTQDDFIVRKK
jgi:hypothetical protein